MYEITRFLSYTSTRVSVETKIYVPLFTEEKAKNTIVRGGKGKCYNYIYGGESKNSLAPYRHEQQQLSKVMCGGLAWKPGFDSWKVFIFRYQS